MVGTSKGLLRDMKITFVFDGLQFGGIERIGIEYIKLLDSKKYTINVVNLRPDLNELEKEVPTGVKILHIPFPRKLAPQYYSKLRRLLPLGLVAFYVFAIPAYIIQKIYKLKYQKYVPESEIAIAFSGHYNDLTFVKENFANAKKIAWLHGSETSYNDVAPGYFALYRKIKNLVCLSEKDDEQCREFNVKNGITKVLIYNPVNLDDRKIDNNTVDSLKKEYDDFVLMVGRMAKDKDQSTLIRAISYLNQKYNFRKKLVLVGDGPERGTLENLVKKYHLESQVYFVGAHYDVQNYYAAASVYAHSSPAEGLPTVLLEAMYYRLPIASTNSEPGVNEILKEECGLITPVGDAESLGESIYKLYTDKALVHKMEIKCQDRIKLFMPKYVISRFDTYIKTLK